MSTVIKYNETTMDEDDPCVIATQLYERHGYKKALSTVTDYIDEAKSPSHRIEWERIAQELAALSMIDEEIQRTGLV